ncbi:hypothetical protein [Hymenobacter jeollabukensis]|uniref:Uncharacterized protein n=1 Tax=Hymenobacter jeollabukensis TaxID=2025313 RepID=A0A5R8WLA4_9BACT|nr:hypothetical protein [Hymenobacter jeollabukensis]TLM90014.1 hypothetical protein FDY95_18515 [Hymenobacter jeollabukensis]
MQNLPQLLPDVQALIRLLLGSIRRVLKSTLFGIRRKAAAPWAAAFFRSSPWLRRRKKFYQPKSKVNPGFVDLAVRLRPAR